MRKLKVLTVVGTRPEIIKLSRIIAKLDAYCDHILVHTGQNYDYELGELLFDDLRLRKPDINLSAAGANGIETIGRVIIQAGAVISDLQPDCVLVLGDTNSCLAVIPAKRRRIPTFHMEAGNRCFDTNVPEEINRRIVDQTSDINLTYSDIAREYLLREGLSPDTVIKTGSPLFEVLSFYRDRIDASDVLARLGLTPHSYFVVSAHREENIELEANYSRLVNLLDAVAQEFRIPLIVSTHPRTQKRIEQRGTRFSPYVRLLKPLAFTDYVQLEMNARAVLSDSGTITEESSILNFPALNIRESHERPEGMEEASVMMVGLELERVLQGLTILSTQPRGESRLLRRVDDYSMPNVSDKVLRIIHSYTDYVRQRRGNIVRPEAWTVDQA